METVNSIHGIPIRLTDERWVHIIENHDELAGYYDNVLDVSDDGFVVTAYFTTRLRLEREVVIWQKQQ
jgi:hypothetical protein